MSDYPVLTEDVIFSYLTHKDLDKKRRTFKKGKEYYEQEKIYDIIRNSKHTQFKAKSIGSNGETWECYLGFKGGKLVAHRCTCPAHANYGGPCKHQIALMFCLEEARQEEIKRERQKEKRTEKYILCSECKNIYEVCHSMCPVCGCPTTENRIFESGEKKNKDILCKECGYRYDQSFEFCPECGCSTTENIIKINVQTKEQEKTTVTSKTTEKKEPLGYYYKTEKKQTSYIDAQQKENEETKQEFVFTPGCLLWIVIGALLFIFLIVIFFIG